MVWFNQLPRRDQIVLLIGAIISTVLLVWLLVFQPLEKSVENHARLYESAKSELAEVKNLVAEYHRYQATDNQQNDQSGVSLDSIVTRAINQNQLSYTSKNPSGNDRLSVRFDNANYEDIMQWLYDIEVSQGILLESLTLRSSGTAGYVRADVRLMKN